MSQQQQQQQQSAATHEGSAVPSLKRTISGGGSRVQSSLLYRMPNSLPSQQQRASPSKSPSGIGPPQMYRAVTSAAAFNRSNTSRPMQPSSSNPVAAPAIAKDWRPFLSIEERQAVRSKIRDAYTATCRNYEELLDATCAIEEELLHISAPSRLDYFKSGFEFENRVKLKRSQMQGQLRALETKTESSAGSQIPSQAQDGGLGHKKPRVC